jgi:hypothetical protein
MRMIVGSIEHQMGLCGCFRPERRCSGSLAVMAGLTLREEAEAALHFYEANQRAPVAHKGDQDAQTNRI